MAAQAQTESINEASTPPCRIPPCVRSSRYATSKTASSAEILTTSKPSVRPNGIEALMNAFNSSTVIPPPQPSCQHRSIFAPHNALYHAKGGSRNGTPVIMTALVSIVWYAWGSGRRGEGRHTMAAQPKRTDRETVAPAQVD